MLLRLLNREKPEIIVPEESGHARSLAVWRKYYWERGGREKAATRKKASRAANPERAREKDRQYRQKQDPAQRRETMRRWRSKNRDHCKAYQHTYEEKNREKLREYYRRKSETDVNYRLKKNLSSVVRAALLRRGVKKEYGVLKYVGCTREFLCGYLEARFAKGMTWNNYGEWEVDHRIPCAEFDLRDPDQRRQCFHYSNLQPLWAKQNKAKNKFLPAPHQAELI